MKTQHIISRPSKSRIIGIRLTREEFIALKRRATKAGMGFSEFCRSQLTKGGNSHDIPVAG